MIRSITTLRGTVFRMGDEVIGLGGKKNTVKEIVEVYENEKIELYEVVWLSGNITQIPYHAVELVFHS